MPRDVSRGIRSSPAQYIDRLVEHLVRDTGDDRTRVKRIHDWIADNVSYDVERFFAGYAGATGYEEVLRTGRAVCAGYATVFDVMCQRADIEAVEVSGYGRGYGFSLFERENVTESNHAWNAVSIDGKWHLVDTTWDAGSLNTSGVLEKKYSTAYFLLRPRAFLHTHFPSDDRWQLLPNPISAEQFENLPFLGGDFFACGAAIRGPIAKMNDVSDWASLDLTVPSDILVSSRLSRTGLVERDGATMSHRDGNKVTVEVLFPGSGAWILDLFAKKLGAPGEYSSIASVGYRASGACDARLPKTFDAFDRLGCQLLEPTRTPLPAGRNIRFRIRVPGARHRLSLSVGHRRWIRLKPEGSGVYAVSARVDDGAAKLLLVMGLRADVLVEF